MATARPQRLRHASDGPMACLLRLVGLALAAIAKRLWPAP